jgi:FixJ family two-component response regulator
MNTPTKKNSAPLVAIVDDDKSVCEGLESLLKSIGFDTAAFSSARCFLSSAKFPGVSCLILDVYMPEMDGIELQRHLTATHPIPIIFITAHRDEKIEEQVMQAGAIRLLPKPFSDEALIEALHLALNA